jgi:hypothetical protein
MNAKLRLDVVVVGAIITGIFINNTIFYYRLYGVINNVISQTEITIMLFLNFVFSVLFLLSLIYYIFYF